MSELTRARNTARALVRRYAVDEPPVDVEQIVKNLGITLVERSLDDELSGMAFISGGKSFIVANSNHHENRKRFTIAHECGHHLLHRDYLLEGVHVDKGILKRDPLSAKGRDIKEIAANAFASELLMPRTLIASLVPRDIDILADGSDKIISDLARRFKVSPAALNIRLINLY